MNQDHCHADETDPYSMAAALAYEALELDNHGQSVVRPHFVINQLARRAGVRRVLDMTCGTGAQCLHLARYGFEVTASDLSEPMLRIAARKAEAEGLSIVFHQADMRNVSLGMFDAILSMYNAIGHLDKNGFLATIRNAREHLNPDGLYLFDIFDRSLMQHMPTYRLIDRMRQVQGTNYVRFAKFLFDPMSGLLSLDLHTLVQRGFEPPDEIDQRFSLQTYTGDELRQLLIRGGFDSVEIIPGAEAVPQDPVASLMNFAVARRPRA